MLLRTLSITACISILTACTMQQHYAPPPQNTVQLQSATHVFLFEKNNIKPLPEDIKIFKTMLQNVHSEAIQRITIHGENPKHKAKSTAFKRLQKRTHAIEHVLMDMGYPKSRTHIESSKGINLQVNDAAKSVTHTIGVEVQWYAVNAPECHYWSHDSRQAYAFTQASDFGCANTNNLGQMIADPHDMLRGKNLAPVDATQPVNAIQTYRAATTSSSGSSSSAEPQQQRNNHLQTTNH